MDDVKMVWYSIDVRLLLPNIAWGYVMLVEILVLRSFCNINRQHGIYLYDRKSKIKSCNINIMPIHINISVYNCINIYKFIMERNGM